MSFWLCKSAQGHWLHTVSRLYRVVFSLSLIALLGGVWYWYGYIPLRQQEEQTSHAIRLLTQRNAFLAKFVRQRPLLEKDKCDLEQKLHDVMIAAKIDDQTIIDRLLMLLKKDGLSCKALSPLPIKQQTYCQKHQVRMVFKGPFKNIRTFLCDLYARSLYLSYNELALIRLKNHKVKGDIKLSFITFGDYEDKPKNCVY